MKEPSIFDLFEVNTLEDYRIPTSEDLDAAFRVIEWSKQKEIAKTTNKELQC